MSIGHGKVLKSFDQGQKPSLLLDFARRKSLIDQVSKSNLITFTRATSATYVGADGLIKTAAVNEARFDHDPTTGESLGLLIEEQRTNHATFSTGLIAFSLNQTTLTANATTAPDGTSTASKIVATATDNAHYAFYGATGLASGSVVSWSCFVKYAGDRYAVIHAHDISPAAFDLLTGEFVSVSPQITSTKAVAFTNGWYRLTITYTSSLSIPYAQVYIGGSPVTSYSYTGNGVDGIYVWGAQIEEAAFPTSYIPTAGAAATRNTDEALITDVLPWHGGSTPTEGTVITDATTYVDDPATNITLFEIWSSFNDRWVIKKTKTSMTNYTIDGGVLINSSDLAVSNPGKTYSSFSGSQMIFGSGETYATVAWSSPTVVYVKFGQEILNLASACLNGHYKRFIYWPTRLDDSDLQEATR